MARSAVRLLARAWARDGRAWWAGTAGAVCLVATTILLIEGLFAGIEGAMNSRVADVYTDDLRVTLVDEGVAPREWMTDLANATGPLAAVQERAGRDAHVTAQAESQFVLTRTSFVDAALGGDAGYEVGGLGYEGPATFSIGILVGMDLADPATQQTLRTHLTAGALPSADGPNAQGGVVELLLSAGRFRDLLNKDETDAFRGRTPSAGELAAYRFEITTVHVRPGGWLGDIVRAPARVVGLFSTGVDALDTLSVVTTLEDVRYLAGYGRDEPVANVLRVDGGNLARVRAWADQEGYHAVGAAGFLDRYLGQLMGFLRVSGLATAVSFTGIALVLAWQGAARQVARHRREILSARAIGVLRIDLERAFFAIAMGSIGLGVGIAILLAVAIGLLLPAALASRLPVPVGFAWPGWSGAALVLAVFLGVGFSARLSVLRAFGVPLAQELRT